MKLSKFKYFKWRLSYNYSAVLRKFFKKNTVIKKVGKKKLLAPEVANGYIAKLIESGKPFMAARFGSTEMYAINNYLKIKLGFSKNYPENAFKWMHFNAGFFPFNDTAAMDKFAQMMLEDCKQVDLLGLFADKSENFMVDTFMQSSQLTRLRGLEPYYYENPWSRLLKGKKVLVIHPFEKSIISQFEKRKHLFKVEQTLPDFELMTIRAVQTIAGEKSEFETWFDALDYMSEQAAKKDFDIAIVGCGAYGFPLAARIKRMGKQVVHLGGAVQVLFGIYGSRMLHNGRDYLINEHWVRPLPEETPTEYKKVEGGCYW